ncbi:type I secretion system permease/ATPase [Stakelama pacifica]|uniref:ATP-binding cassette subfamily C protein LapB n=1 Tax=Stakelama pacifica TaxID=517720 RepID=A0A4R6G0L5_9SPHN|nr:type I secretion system permease/ATPase [Stakelama pacifica]TDN87014.1 ATP-binding cassette subfamily C protein LapB [Stakelama pacifica]GGO91346.1 ABC transporter ATP-binding protein [Stakelama pacifica]
MKVTVQSDGEARSDSLTRWVDMLRIVARQYRLPLSEQSARNAGAWQSSESEQKMVRAIARASGLGVRFSDAKEMRLTRWRLPLIARLDDGELALVTALEAEGGASVTLSGDDGMASRMPVDQLLESTIFFVIPRPARSAPDPRVDAYIRPYEEHWLRRILLRDAPAYGHVMVASIIANCLALATVLFSMQVYDRVVPAKSMPTLYILFIGVLLAIGFDFLLQRLRMEIVDVLGKRADLRMSDRVFGHALRVRTSARPRSTGTFIAQLRDLDQVRDLLTSTTVAAIADLPFFLLFLTILWFIGGVLALVPLGAAVLLVVPGILAQRRMRNYATEAMRESSLRNALLVESVQGIEDIKTLQAEDRFQQQWNHYNSVSGEAQLKLRGLTNGLTIWTRNVQNGVYAGVVFVGAPMVIAGDITTGALVAVSILGSRMMAPMAQVSQLLSRFQQARIAAQGLDEIMALPVDAPEAEQRIPLPAIAGSFALRQAAFAYGEPDAPPALTIAALDIAQGEKVGLLGRNGAGKSTLLQGLSGLMRPVAGEVLIDDLAMHQVDPADLRRDIGVLTQDSRLFHGTLRENLTLGAPQASAQAIWQALAMVGAAPFVKQLRDGLEHVVLEGGKGLSGGQVQTLLLARLLLRDPAVVLLDEPTAAMDETAERQFIQRFKPWAAERTVILATHRMRVLDMVDRVIVIDSGRIVLDQPRDAALRTMQQAKGQQAKASSAA